MGVKALSADQLAAKQAIYEVICRYSRAIDRFDMDLLLSCWHPGGTDSRPPLFEGTAQEFAKWVKPTLSSSLHTTHVVSNVLIDLRGNEAGVETYWMATLRVPRGDKIYDLVRGGRYLDRFSCMAGEWAIQHRRSITDWSRIEELNPEVSQILSAAIPPASAREAEKPARDGTDPSYQILSLF